MNYLDPVLSDVMCIIEQNDVFVYGELPVFIHELLRHYLWQHLFGLFVFTAVAYWGFSQRAAVFSYLRREIPLKESAGVIYAIYLCIFVLGSAGAALYHLFWALQVWFAPRIYLLWIVA